MRFAGKNGALIWGCLALWCAFALILCLADGDLVSSAGFWVGFLLPLSFIVPSMVRNYVELQADCLFIAYGFSSNRIPLRSITSVERSRTKWAASANSLDRVRIGIGRYSSEIVALKDNDAFIKALRAAAHLDGGA